MSDCGISRPDFGHPTIAFSNIPNIGQTSSLCLRIFFLGF